MMFSLVVLWYALRRGSGQARDNLSRDTSGRQYGRGGDAARVDTGRYDNELAVWIVDWEIASVEVVASHIERAYEAGRGGRSTISADR
jgi:hypothetical protein